MSENEDSVVGVIGASAWVSGDVQAFPYTAG